MGGNESHPPKFSTINQVTCLFNPIGSAVQNFFAGRPEKEIFYKDVLDLARERVKKKEGHGGEEKIRAYWPYMSVFFDIAFCEWMDKELGMTSVSDLFNYFFFDPIPNEQFVPLHVFLMHMRWSTLFGLFEFFTKLFRFFKIIFLVFLKVRTACFYLGFDSEHILFSAKFNRRPFVD